MVSNYILGGSTVKTTFIVVLSQSVNWDNRRTRNREEYRSQLIDTNRKQREFYQESWPSILSGTVISIRTNINVTEPHHFYMIQASGLKNLCNSGPCSGSDFSAALYIYSMPIRGSQFLPCDIFQLDLEPKQKSKINLLNTFLCYVYIDLFQAKKFRTLYSDILYILET
jgi:hypothetical protein